MNFQSNSLRKRAATGSGSSAASAGPLSTGDGGGWTAGRRSAGLRAGLIQTHVPKSSGPTSGSHQAAPAASRGCRCRALPQDILCLDKDADGASCHCSARPYGKNKSGVSAQSGDYVMEEYKLDDKELAALEKLYDFPARSGRASAQVRAVSIIDTLSQMARTPEARRLAQPPPDRPQAAKQPLKQAPKQSPVAKQATKPPTKRTASGGGGGGRSEADGPPPAPTLDREAIIARLLAEAARSPPPPIPSRRPDLSVLNIRAESANNAAVRGKLPTPPAGGGGGSGGAGGRQRDDLLDDLYGRIKGRRPPELRRTPDWIRTIFDVARGGDITELRSSLADMEPTLIRNLSDHHGNNLAHVLAACGHVQALAWLVGTCGHVLSEALADENKHGLTPSVAAVRCGKLDVIRWMVENTVIRERLFTREGERSLLHAAAKYGQVEITSWCADQLAREGQSMDLADHHGDTPLHLAAKTGNTAVAQKLLERNASVTARNDMSLKPFELAVHHGHGACAEFLLTYEALGDLAVDFTSLEAEAGRLQHENADYKNNFREVLSVSRKLLREREDMCKDLSRLHESTLELHDRLLGQLQQLSAENRQLRRRLQEDADEEPADQLDESSELANTLHVRWQHCQRAWFSAPLADTQHRLLMAEQAWKRLRASRKDNVNSMTSAQEIVRNKIGDLRAQSAQARYLDPAALSSSENSLVDSELYQQISPRSVVRTAAASDIYGAAKSPDTSELCGAGARANGRRRAAGSRETLEAGFLSEHEPSDIYGRGASGGRRRPARAPRPARERRGKSVEKMERLSVSVTGGGGAAAHAAAAALTRNLDLSKSLDFSDSVLSGTDEVHNSTFSARPRAGGGGGGGGGGEGEGGTPERAAAQDELRRQLRGLALVSDSGSASVLEVIEPAGSEAGSTVDLVQREIEAQRRARQARSRDSSRSRDRRQEPPAAAEAAKQLEQVRMRRNTTTEDDSDFLGLRTSKPHRSKGPAVSEAGRAASVVSGVSVTSAGGEGTVRRARGGAESGWRSDGGASLASLVLSEPDILQGTRHTLERPEEPAPAPLQPAELTPDEAADELERPLYELDGRLGATPDAGGAKRRGFLQKFAMRTRWNSRKKGSAWRAGVGEISGDEFREMYQQEGRDLSVSSQDLSASEASSLEEKKRTSLGEVGSLSEASDAEHRSKRASVASKRESDSNEPEAPLREAAAKPPPAAAGAPEKRAPPPSAPAAADAAAEKPAPPPKPKIAAKPSTLPRRAPAAAAAAADPVTEEVPRPASSASRPDSSASSFPPYKGFALSAGGAGSLSAELLPAAEGGAAGRHSPAPSEASKTESALSPPSHASDVSKTESTRHLNQLDKIEELRAESAQKLTADTAEEAAAPAPAEETHLPPPAAPPQPVAPKLKRGVEKKLRRRRDDRPWYEVSDDESDLLHGARYPPVQRSSSDEDAQLI